MKVTYFNDTKEDKILHSATNVLQGVKKIKSLEMIEFEIEETSELFIKDWSNGVMLFQEIKKEC